MTTMTADALYGPAPLTAPPAEREGAAPASVPAAPSETEVTTRFLQFLIPAAATAVSTFGPQIGSAIGGLFGGSEGAKTGGQIGGTVGGLLGGLFGGRGFVPDELPSAQGNGAAGVDLTAPMLQECTMQCVGKIVPDLATMLQGLSPQLKPATGESRSAEAEIEVLERFWPDIASFVTQQVGQHLPDIIATVTSTVMPLLGTREAAEFRPLLTGREANARWFLPVLSSVLTAVQENLPTLIEVLGGGSRAPRDTAITWQDISTYGRFWDNDFIRVVGQDDLGDSTRVDIVLELAPHLSWAKQIQIRDDNGALVHRLHVQDSRKVADGSVAADQLLTNGSLLFAKAKMFGVMTGMYVLPTAGLEQLRGKRTRFRWMSD